MDDLRKKLEKLLAEAEDCDLIGRLAADPVKRDTFRSLAERLRHMADDVEASMERLRSYNQQKSKDSHAN